MMFFFVDDISSHISNYPYTSVVALIALCVGIYLCFGMGRSRNRTNPLAKPGLVVVHGGLASTTVIAPSPYVLKLLTFLRMANIDYVNDPKRPLGKKGKMPWIELDDESYCDSSFIIEHLTKRFNVNIDDHLNEEQKAVARVIQKMVEENTVHAAIGYHRWIQDIDFFCQMLKFSKWICCLIKAFVVPGVKKNLYAQGVGRHSAQEIEQIARADIKALSVFLKDKQYFFGDKPSTLDASVFGFLANVLYGLREGSWPNQLVRNEYPNLVGLFERMKERYWPDWNESLLQ